MSKRFPYKSDVPPNTVLFIIRNPALHWCFCFKYNLAYFPTEMLSKDVFSTKQCLEENFIKGPSGDCKKYVWL